MSGITRNKQKKLALWKQNELAKSPAAGPQLRRIRSVSKRRQGRMREYRARAKLFRLLQPECQCCRRIFGRKPAPATEVHHSRGRVASLLLDERFWIAACGKCHDWCHANPSTAREKGLFCDLGKWNSPPVPGQCDRCRCALRDR